MTETFLAYFPRILPIFLLLVSNVFMTFAWYGHLKFKTSSLVVVILASWGIAFFEYCFQVPANRLGNQYFSVAQLKTIQEVITFSVFIAFSYFYLNEKITWPQVMGFLMICAGAFLVFKKWS